jgi:hypothetical protein
MTAGNPISCPALSSTSTTSAPWKVNRGSIAAREAGERIDDRQHPQLPSGHEFVGEYVDSVSGRRGTRERKQFAALFEDASRRKFDCVLFWALDR